MKKNEALWIAISALQWVIFQCEKDITDPTGVEHINEKKEALELLKNEVK